MPQAYKSSQGWMLQIVLAMLTAVWVWNFLPVMQQLHLVYSSSTFLWVFGFFVVFQFMPLLFRLLGPGIISLFYAWYYFRPHGSPFLVGLRELKLAFTQAVWALLRNHGLVDPLQTMVFVWVLGVIYWLVVYASRHRKLWVFYNGLAILVFALVDGNTPVHPNRSLLGDLAIGLLVLGLNHYASLSEWNGAGGRSAARFFVPLAVVMTFSFLVALALPKQPPVWADPFQGPGPGSGSGSGSGSGGSQLVIGYQSNNAHLGGSFVMNYQPLLSVVTKYPTYLRGETYATYTGKGWIQSNFNPQPVFANQAFQLQSDATFRGLASQNVSQQVAVLSNSLQVNVLFGAYTMNKVLAENGTHGAPNPYVNPENGTVYGGLNLVKGETYRVDSQELEDPANALSHLKPVPDLPATYPAAIQSYLQLPASLPNQVRTLAEKITTGDVTEYDKIMAIQNYLQQHYLYSTQGIPVPGPGQDYVDQFLFQSEKGYCNNFSSAMAVMLRTLGIPTRWVTGFTFGQQDFSYSGPQERFIVRNSDAHSWVEVYFPQVGWVPFDPTPNFTMTYAPASTAGQSAAVPPAKVTVPPVKPTPKPTTPSQNGQGGGGAGWLGISVVALEWVAGGLFVLGASALILSRRRIHAARLWAGMTPTALGRAVTHLMRLLAKAQGLPNASPTLRELLPVARDYGVHEQEYREFVHTAEKVWYAGEPVDEHAMHQARRTWGGWVSRLYKQNRKQKTKRRKKQSLG